MPRWLVGTIAVGAVGLSFLIALLEFFAMQSAGEHPIFNAPLYSWIPVGDFKVDIAFLLDPLSALMLLVVTGVGFLIHVYSIGYMAEDENYGRFFTYLNLFVFSMLMLVLGNNYLVMYMGWELVGLCSFLLISFCFTKPSAAAAGKKAFVTTRIGDFGFGLGVILIFVTFGSLYFEQVFAEASKLFQAGAPVITAITLLLFMGAVGKSAQLPLYVWLPDAMEGPTPVSALIHAATMVTAGVYMVARSTPMIALVPQVQVLVAVIGCLTALLSASIALTQTDLKRVLAYSTVSQLGFMFMALGAGVGGVARLALVAAMFHLFTHAFFKALLFLGSGSGVHATGGVIDMRRFRGLRHRLPWTCWTFAVGGLALAGIPPMAGFWSKDEILVALKQASHAAA